jgi:uncharacterized protein YbbC (DUF1343 family)
MRYISLLAVCIAVLSCSQKTAYYLPHGDKKVKTGLEVFLKGDARRYAGKKAAIATNHSGADFNLKSNIASLREKKIDAAFILAPEHGIYGFENEYDTRGSLLDATHNLRVHNLHKMNLQQLRLLLKDIELIIFDIQDMGMRCYTYISDLKFIMDAIEGTQIKLIVLDRPNPTDFIGIDGAYLDPQFYARFISSFPSTFLYGLTIGEAAMYYKGEFKKNVDLKVVRMKGYSKRYLYNQTSLPWIPPSPNLPTYESAIVYTGIVLMEGINISIGRGTTKPFEYIGAPWIEPVQFCAELEKLGLKNFRFKPVYFEPFFSKHVKRRCGGAQIFYTGGSFSPTEFSYKVISMILKKYKQAGWERQGTYHSVDYLAGTDMFRKYVTAGRDYKDFQKDTAAGREKFRKISKRYRLY